MKFLCDSNRWRTQSSERRLIKWHKINDIRFLDHQVDTALASFNLFIFTFEWIQNLALNEEIVILINK